ncbi:MAG: HAMP domain-containing histidine kinase [Gammaproteobacteria bacterium]|nr:HAMP domain-containing histidine kinase [Gammaproteobacteria bacterium]
MAYVTIEKNIEASIEREVNAAITRFVGDTRSIQLGIKTEPYAFFIEKDGQKVAGNLTEIPEQEKKSKSNQDLIQIEAESIVANPGIEHKGEILGKTITLPNQTKVFIGKNSYDATERREDILDALTTALFFLLTFGFIGGLIISFQSIKRIDHISRISKLIKAGDLNQRIPASKYNDDIDDLSQNLNNMLDRINILMLGMKEVSNNIAHDLRTPLTRLRANIETISRKGSGEIQEEAEKALIETDNLLNTFSSLLRISQVESGASNLQKNTFDLGDLVHEVMDFYDVLAEEKEQQISLSIDKSIMVDADKNLLSQAIVNLFTNAVKYTPSGGRIRIVLAADKGVSVAELIIHDSGMGVPEDKLGKITQRFYRLEEHRSSGDGNGLGLSMAKAIVNAHNGKLIFENDIGLKAIIQLPLSSDVRKIKSNRQKSNKAH